VKLEQTTYSILHSTELSGAILQPVVKLLRIVCWITFTICCHYKDCKWSINFHKLRQILLKQVQHLYIISARCNINAVNAHTEVAISHARMPEQRMREVSHFCSQNWLHGNIPWDMGKRGPDQSSAPITLSFGEKIMKMVQWILSNCSASDH